MEPGKIIIIWILSVSAVAFAITVTDKILAKRNARRVPEKWFIVFSLIGGGLGVLSAFYLVRHKTKHIKLLVTVWIVSILTYAAAVAFLFLYEPFILKLVS